MTRSTTLFMGIGFGLFLLGSVACGGETPPPQQPQTPMEMPDAGEETTQPASDHGDQNGEEPSEQPANP